MWQVYIQTCSCLWQVCLGWNCDMWDVLKPVRDVRLRYGGPGFNEELLWELRQLYFDLGWCIANNVGLPECDTDIHEYCVCILLSFLESQIWLTWGVVGWLSASPMSSGVASKLMADRVAESQYVVHKKDFESNCTCNVWTGKQWTCLRRLWFQCISMHCAA